LCADEKVVELPDKVAIYTRVSSSENKDNLDRQAERLEEYCMARGYRISKVVKEIGRSLKSLSVTRVTIVLSLNTGTA